jgi:maltose alpha-D-glucosyltransferase/alpha-amylase
MLMTNLWYKDAVFYEVHVKAFQDANGDGVGDFQGLTQRLDYVQDLGVDCLWLLPFFPSPLRDDGYDIADYDTVSPLYGRMEHFREFLAEAHRRGIKVIADLVVNHTSDQHAWFQEARRDPGSPKRDYYVWNDTDRRYSGARIIFVDTENSNWTWDPEAKAYFWHRFFSHQPDLNYDNPAVQQAMLGVMRFWLDQGLDGFRCDAVPYLFEREDTNCENLPETHSFLKRLRATLDAEYRGRILLAEANQWPRDVRPYFGDGDEFHMAFHFPLMPRMFMAVRSADRRPITDMFLHTPPIPDACQWCVFLRNHDELTLEMCTDPERDYMYYAYAQDPVMKLNIGIRRRLAPLLENDRRKIELLYSLLFTLPGTPIVYYGDEIGMGDNIYLKDRNGVRTPMQWSADRNAGFSRTDPSQLYSPVIADPVYGYQAVNVEAQLRSSSSLLHWMRRVIAARKSSRVFGRGTLSFLAPTNTRVLAHLREYQGEAILAVHNLAASAEPVELDLRAFRGAVPIEMLGEARFPPIGDSPYFVSLGPYGYYWLRLERPQARTETYGIETTAI